MRDDHLMLRSWELELGRTGGVDLEKQCSEAFQDDFAEDTADAC